MAEDSEKLAQLVVQLQSGDMAAFDEIYKLTNEKAVFTSLKICRNKEDANDIVQESYMYLLEKVNDIKNPKAFTSWFNMVVASKTKNMLRKKKPVLFNDNETEELVLDSIEDTDKDFHPPSDFEQTELRTEVMSLIDGLSDDKRAAVILFYYEEMTTKQIAESLGVNENTIKSRLVQAKKDLAKGVKELEKKNKSLYGIAPVPLIIWALKNSAKVTGKAFATSGKAAATLATVKATYTGAAVASGAAAAGTTASVAGASTAGGFAAKIAGLSVAQKIIFGVVVAGIVTGGAVGTKAAINRQKGDDDRTTTEVVQMVDVTEKSRITEEIRESDNLATSEKVSSTTRLTSTTIVSSTKSTTNSTTYVATKTQAETKTTTAKIITTAKKATINIIVTQSGEQKTTKTVMVNAGETFTFNDAKNYVKAMGYDTSTAMYEGSLPITAESGKVYSIIIDVE